MPLKQVLKEQGLDIEELAAAAYEIGRPLPWQHLDMGFTEAYLISEWRKAQRKNLHRCVLTYAAAAVFAGRHRYEFQIKK